VNKLFVVFVSVMSLSAVQARGERTFTGVITDDQCAMGNHQQMQMGPTDADCVRACIAAHGAQYVLYDGTTAYLLSDQETPEQFAAQKVAVVGTLDAKANRIAVKSIAAVR
jgi:hypothetical protein